MRAARGLTALTTALLGAALLAGCAGEEAEPEAVDAVTAEPETTSQPQESTSAPEPEPTSTPLTTITPGALDPDVEAICVDGLAATDETMREALTAVREDDLFEAQRQLQRAADDLDALAERSDADLEDGELADAFEDYAAVLRYGDDLDAIEPARTAVETACLTIGF